MNDIMCGQMARLWGRWGGAQEVPTFFLSSLPHTHTHTHTAHTHTHTHTHTHRDLLELSPGFWMIMFSLCVLCLVNLQKSVSFFVFLLPGGECVFVCVRERESWMVCV